MKIDSRHELKNVDSKTTDSNCKALKKKRKPQSTEYFKEQTTPEFNDCIILSFRPMYSINAANIQDFVDYFEPVYYIFLCRDTQYLIVIFRCIINATKNKEQ